MLIEDMKSKEEPTGIVNNISASVWVHWWVEITLVIGKYFSTANTTHLKDSFNSLSVNIIPELLLGGVAESEVCGFCHSQGLYLFFSI